jgi:sulfite reductase (NADPH) flavoprotein alpha-component
VQEKIFLATIKERVCLNVGSDKETYHLIVDLEGSDIEYHVGDCLGIYPQNDPSQVQSIIHALSATGEEIVEDRKGRLYPLYNYLLGYANLSRLPQGSDWTPASYCKRLAPQLPRFYSIASAKSVVGNEAHLTVGLIDGICSHFLCKRAPIGEPVLSVFHHPSRNFSLPSDSFDKPIIMIGPGTGIAPFRGFMQERLSKNVTAKNWLFFGERHQNTDFYYQSFWEELVRAGHLELDCAFSRDQEEKVYVQHKMFDKKKKIWDWLQQGAYLFVCGNASKMAKDVEQTLVSIIESEGGQTPENAKFFLKELKKIGRYQRDVY